MLMIAQIHDGWLMVLSYVIAFAASYTVITLIGEMSVRKDRLRLFYSAFTTGIGLWTAQFFAMMAYRTPLSANHHFYVFLLSAAVPFFAFLAAFSILSDTSPSSSKGRLALGSLIAGTGVCAMHFVGVHAIHLQADLTYDAVWIMLSWALAVTAAYVSFRLAYRFRGNSHGWKALCSLIMGLGAVGVHYMAMNGTTFRYDQPMDNMPIVAVSDMFVAGTVGIAALFLSGISVMSLLVNRRLRVAELKYSSLFEQSPELVIIADVQGKVLRSNRRSSEVAGYEAEEIVGRNLLEFVCPEDMASAQESLAKSLAGQGHSMEIGIIGKTGDRNDVSVSSIPMLAEGVLQGVCIIVKNITLDKMMKEQLRQLTERHELILNTMVEGVYGLDADRRTVFWNKAAEEMTGYSSADLLGREAHDLIHHTHSDGTSSKPEHCAIFTAMKERKQYHMPDELFWRKDGSSFPVEYTVNPIVSAGSETAAAVVTFRDITELKQAREMIRRSEKLTMAGELAAGIAHEIRNPLTAIKGFIQLMKERMPVSYYDIILSEIGRIELITSELLMLSKPQAVEYQPTYVPVILDHVVTLLESEAIMHDVQIVRSYEGPSLHVSCDPNQLKQVFINMVKNSIEAMPSGGTITIEAKADRSDIVIAVRDEGVGISEDKIRMLGQPFYTTKEKGTGLGMMVSLNIVENHGGRVNVTSEPGLGTEIRVFLPACLAS